MIGTWQSSPIGSLDDLMWARPDGRRLLLASSEEAVDYVSAVYAFDEVVVGPLVVDLHGADRHGADRHGAVLHLRAPAVGLEVHLAGGMALAFPWPRPAWFTRWVEGPVARRLLGVNTYGVSPSGVREWYRAVSVRRLVAGWASIDGRDLGRLGPIDPPTGFGFSEPPRFPTMVGVRPLLEWPTTRAEGRSGPGLRPRPKRA